MYSESIVVFYMYVPYTCKTVFQVPNVSQPFYVTIEFYSKICPCLKYIMKCLNQTWIFFYLNNILFQKKKD